MFWKRRSEEPVVPEWLIVGLGNPGGEYAHTRHNVGFVVIDELARKHRIKMGKAKHRALTGVGRISGVQVVLAKPLTYMNLSGQAVAPLARAYGLKPERVLVVVDDMNLDLGRVRLKPKGSSGGQNGLKSIIATLHTEEFPRIRIGIGSVAKGGATGHVLSHFSPQERSAIDEAIDRAVEGCEAVATEGLERALSLVNTPKS
jgi:peptidyl-tRNA hydrolase, PTH1 family